MSEPIKNPNQTPESYSPKKPEILDMAESAGKIKINRAYPVKAANGGSYIDGVPMLKWGERKDCTYSGAVALLLNVMGINAIYEQVAGLTGSCYRMSMCYGWDPGSLIVNVNYAYLGFGSACGTDYNANRAFGLDFYTIADETERNEKVQKSIDAGAPVLALGSRAEPEWCMITGYEKTADGVKYFGRSYFDGDVSENDLCTDNRYTICDRYPGEWPEGFLKLCDKRCEPLSAKDALKVSLETCLKMFAPHEKIGYGAYEFMIKSLKENKYPNHENNREYSGWDICMHFQILLDARRAAYAYLEENAGLLSGSDKAKLMSVSAMYKDMYDALSSVVPYEELNKLRDSERFNSWFSAALRTNIVDALQKMVSLEKQARVIVSDILDNWEESK